MPRFDTKISEYNLLASFWSNVRSDITGHGCLFTIDTLSHLPYALRVIEERRILKAQALDFIYSSDFVQWAEMSGADSDALREDLLNAYHINS